MAKKPFRPREEKERRIEGIMQRWNWRTKARIGNHWTVHGKEMRKLIRQFSWRRAH